MWDWAHIQANFVTVINVVIWDKSLTVELFAIPFDRASMGSGLADAQVIARKYYVPLVIVHSFIRWYESTQTMLKNIKQLK